MSERRAGRWVGAALVGYPLIALALVVALFAFSRSKPEAPSTPERSETVDTSAGRSDPAPDPPQTEQLDPQPVLAGEETVTATPPAIETAAAEPTLRERARAIADGIGDRFVSAAAFAAEHVDRESLLAGGEKLARFVPFVGPYVRYHEARQLHRQDDPEARQRARRLTVIALAELSLDAGSAGLGGATSKSTGLLDALDGAVDLVELSKLALKLKDLFGDERTVEKLAGRALEEIDGLAPVVDALLEIEPADQLSELSGDLAARARALIEAVERRIPGQD